MNKEEFLNKYPEISLELLEKYMKAMQNKDLHGVLHYSWMIAVNIDEELTVNELSKDMELLLEHYDIDYRYSEKWEWRD